MESCTYLEDTTLTWTSTSTISGNSIQVIHYSCFSDWENVLQYDTVKRCSCSAPVISEVCLCFVHSSFFFFLLCLYLQWLFTSIKENAAVLTHFPPHSSVESHADNPHNPLFPYCIIVSLVIVAGCSLLTMSSGKCRCCVFFARNTDLKNGQ